MRVRPGEAIINCFLDLMRLNIRTNYSYSSAAGLGAVSGMRSLLGLALVSRDLAGDGRRFRPGTLENILGSEGAARALTLLAAGELVADKTPFVGARTEPLPLLGRALAGAASAGAHAASRGGNGAVAALVGGASAIVTTVGMYHLRRQAVRRLDLPDPGIALIEDGIAIGAGLALVDD